MQDIERDIGSRHLPGTADDLGPARQLQALLQAAGAGPSVGAERDKLAVEDRGPRAELLPRLAQLGKGAGDVLVVAADRAGPAAADVNDGAQAIPHHLIRPVIVAGGQRPGDREHRRNPLGQRLKTVPGRIHPVDHPVPSAGGKQHVAAAGLRPVQDDLDFGIGPLLELVLAVIPDAYLAAAVLTFPDIALEAAVLERVILGVDGQVIRRRVLRHALRQRPRDQDAVMLKTEIPVQGPRVVLLHDERPPAIAGLSARLRRSHRFRGPGRITLGPVGGERGAVILSALPCASHQRTRSERPANIGRTVASSIRPARDAASAGAWWPIRLTRSRRCSLVPAAPETVSSDSTMAQLSISADGG